MCLITHTNIVVDGFSYGKATPEIRYIYFLSHFHADHWTGLTPKWDFGTIYCTPLTKKLILNRFPNIPDVRELELNIEHTIYLNETKTLSVQVFLFDANHCPGAAMILFKGYMGTILHTGDFRFHRSMIDEYEILYPKHLRTPNLAKCSIHIDELILDNTYCDPIFKFPNRDKALRDLIDIIEKNKGKRIYISIYTLGKEEMLICLAEYFKTLIVVDERRYGNIVDIDYRPELFTTDPTKGWILLSSVQDEEQNSDNSIHITTTGWANVETYASADGKKFIVPYSLHSNFEEMEMFTRSIHPSKLKAVVRNTNTAEKINNIHRFGGYMNTLMHLKQRGFEMFEKYYTSPNLLSKEYKKYLDLEEKEKLELELGLKKPIEDINLVSTDSTSMNSLKIDKKEKKSSGANNNNKLKKNKTMGDFGKIDKKNSLERLFSKGAENQKVHKAASLTPETKPSTPLYNDSKATTRVSTPKSGLKGKKEENMKLSFSDNHTNGIKEVPNEIKEESIKIEDSLKEEKGSLILREEKPKDEILRTSTNQQEIPPPKGLLTSEPTFDCSETEKKFKNLAPIAEEPSLEEFKFTKNKPRVVRKTTYMTQRTQSTTISETKTEKREGLQSSPFETGVFTQMGTRDFDNIATISESCYQEFDEIFTGTSDNNIYNQNMKSKHNETLNSKENVSITRNSLKRKYTDHLNIIAESVKMGLNVDLEEKDCHSPVVHTKIVKVTENIKLPDEIGVTQWSQ